MNRNWRIFDFTSEEGQTTQILDSVLDIGNRIGELESWMDEQFIKSLDQYQTDDDSSARKNPVHQKPRWSSSWWIVLNRLLGCTVGNTTVYQPLPQADYI